MALTHLPINNMKREPENNNNLISQVWKYYFHQFSYTDPNTSIGYMDALPCIRLYTAKNIFIQKWISVYRKFGPNDIWMKWTWTI